VSTRSPRWSACVVSSIYSRVPKVREIADSGHSIVIAQNGKPAVVVMNVAQHDPRQDTLAMLKLLVQSQASLVRTART
jgi:PHD/YefM family antitoxin component YafN of YafNO toxin-antitoxin module